MALPLIVPLILIDAGLALAATAVDTSAPADPMSGLAQYGVLGIIAGGSIGALTWFVKGLRAQAKEQAAQLQENYKAVVERNDRLETENREERAAHAAEVKELNRVYSDKVLPSILAMTQVMQETQRLLADRRDR